MLRRKPTSAICITDVMMPSSAMSEVVQIRRVQLEALEAPGNKRDLKSHGLAPDTKYVNQEYMLLSTSSQYAGCMGKSTAKALCLLHHGGLSHNGLKAHCEPRCISIGRKQLPQNSPAIRS